MLDFVVSAGGSVAVAPGALRERQVPVRFRVQMKALVCGSRPPFPAPWVPAECIIWA